MALLPVVRLIAPFCAVAPVLTLGLSAQTWADGTRTSVLIIGVITVLEAALLLLLVAALQRRTATQRVLELHDSLNTTILDSLTEQIAVLDRDGTIIAVNKPWAEFGRTNRMDAIAGLPIGSNYLRSAGAIEGTAGRQVLSLVRSVCAGEPTGGQVEHRRAADGRERWFLTTVRPLRAPEHGAVVTHSDITERKVNEMALQDSEDRFCRMADALPMAIWISGPDGLCSYFNGQWLALTGRTLQQEIGFGWLDNVHADDREACIAAYLSAFRARDPLSIEYRVRRHDDEWRWVRDTGIARYADGAFLGYIGGRMDITDRKDSEQVLRDLSRRLIAAQEDERRRIARELHDHLSQQLALLAIELQQLMLLSSASNEPLSTGLQDLWRRTSEIASDVHAISHRLHPSKLEALGLVRTIRAYARDMSRQHLSVDVVEENVPANLPPDVALSVFRVAEEALTNALRHSGASEAQVAVLGSDGELIVRISDSGRGFNTARRHASGLGVVSMRERIEGLGGTFTITSARQKGTIVEVHVPCSRAPEPRTELAVPAALPRIAKPDAPRPDGARAAG
jgi:PAS domain S-box-containing protein